MKYALIVVWLLTLGARASAQEAPMARESTKSSLSGIVIKEPGGEPIKKAIVELIAENQEEGGNYTATSNEDGHFKIAGIQPGRYRMFVERPGYLEVDEKRRRSQGVVLSFNAGGEIKNQTLHMLAAAVITGRVLDEDGDPMPGVEVKVLRRKFGAGHSTFEGPGTETNDLGEFRIGGLMAGKYYVSASPTPSVAGMMFLPKRVDETAPSEDKAYVTTYYPNAIDRSQAAAIELHPGDETPLHFSLLRTHTARIRGSISGLVPGTKAVIVLRARDSNTMFIAADVDKDGKFDIPHVPPGAYGVIAATETSDTPLSIRQNIEVTDSDIDGLSLSPLAGTTIRGRVHFPSKGKTDLSLLFVALHRVDGAEDTHDSIFFAEDGNAEVSAFGRVKEDGSFELKDVLPGRYEIEVSSSSKAMTNTLVESVATGTKELGDTGLKVNGGTITVDVTVSMGAGEVEGTAVNDKKEPIANAVVVAVPEERFRKQQSHYQRAATDQEGRFQLRGLRPGKYTLYAWDALDGEDYLDPDFLKQFEKQETPVKVEKASRQTVALKVLPATDDQP
jgi:protocatechuate 3,4-dioxygenase beta subunit